MRGATSRIDLSVVQIACQKRDESEVTTERSGYILGALSSVIMAFRLAQQNPDRNSETPQPTTPRAQGNARLARHSVNPWFSIGLCASPPTEEPAGQRVVRRFPLPPIRDGGHPSVRLTSEGPSARPSIWRLVHQRRGWLEPRPEQMIGRVRDRKRFLGLGRG